MSKPDGTPLLSMRDIVKAYPGVQALRGVNLTLRAGEVLGLLGGRGAGKSTLMGVLAGACRPDAGTIAIDGRTVRFRTPRHARRAGVALVRQEFDLIPALAAWENVFLGQEITRLGLIARREERRRATEIFRQLGAQLNPDTPCSQLFPAQQQLVEIARALAGNARILIMDEPSAALTAKESERLLATVAELRGRGLGIIFISHRLEEITRIADRVSVLRDGANTGEHANGQTPHSQWIEEMSGRGEAAEFPPRKATIGGVVLTAKELCRQPVVQDVSFKLRAGEILAITGLIGSGRTEMARLIFGADLRDFGEIRRGRRVVRIGRPRDAIDAGIGLLTADRQVEGLALGHSIQENFALPNLTFFSRAGFVDRERQRRHLKRHAETLRMKVPDTEERVRNLSSGNQQKVVLAKWIARDCDVLIFDEPTRGLDAAARVEFYELMNTLAARGKAILMISSDLREVLGMADRILVMRGGRVTGEITDVRQATVAQIMELAVATPDEI
jgi:ABC-type sugar transport system ATPase subunit